MARLPLCFRPGVGGVTAADKASGAWPAHCLYGAGAIGCDAGASGLPILAKLVFAEIGFRVVLAEIGFRAVVAGQVDIVLVRDCQQILVEFSFDRFLIDRI